MPAGDALIESAGCIDERDMVGPDQPMSTVADLPASPKVDARRDEGAGRRSATPFSTVKSTLTGVGSTVGPAAARSQRGNSIWNSGTRQLLGARAT